MPRNTLVLTSGGILGVSYGGVFRCMEERGIDLDSFTEVYGTSIGALIGLLVVIGFSKDNIRRLLMNLPISRLFQITSEGLIGFADNQGIDNGSGIRGICRHILERFYKNPDLTLGELGQKTEKHFVVNATDVCRGKMVLLGTKETPGVKVEDAIVASAAIRFLYSPVRIKDMVLVDGGVTTPLLLHLVAEEDLPNTIAVVPMTKMDTTGVEDVPGMAKSVYYTMMNSGIENLIQKCGEEAAKRVMYIRTPVDSTNMLSQEADSTSLRETLDFLGYTEANRSDVILQFGSVKDPASKEDTEPSGPPDQSVVEQEPAKPFLPPADEGSDMSELPPRDKPSGPPHSLPPPIETRGEDSSQVKSLTYQPVV